MPADLAVSAMMFRYGREAVLASLSPRQAKEVELLTSGTYGPTGNTSSRSAALQSSLESRLREQLATGGSTLFALTWRRKATPSGRPYCQLVASALRTSDSACGSWPTPNAIPEGRGGLQSNPQKAPERREQGHQLNLDDAACLASWPTAAARDWKSTASNKHGVNARPLNEVARLSAPWPTPMAGTPAQKGYNAAGNDSSRKTVALASWVSPTVTDAHRGVLPPRPHDTGIPLSQQCGMILNGSPAPTEKPGQLNPAFSLWLMGYNQVWIVYSPFKSEL